jgi:hypothetical protein
MSYYLICKGLLLLPEIIENPVDPIEIGMTTFSFSLVVKPILMNVHHLPVQIMVLVLIKSMVIHVIVPMDISVRIV